MPYECANCGTVVEIDPEECPGCRVEKTSWTVIQDKTRTLRVSRKKLRLLKGDGDDPLAKDDSVLAGVLLEPTAKLMCLSKDEVSGVHDADELPAPADLVYVELRRGNATDLTIALEVLYAGKPSEELEFPRQAGDDDPESVLVPFLFVQGDEELEGVEFEDVHLVDLSEATEEGFAPTVEFSALGLPTQELSVEIPVEFQFSV